MNHYKNYSDYIKEHFDYKVQKISINAGFTCPNRDGSIGVGGCTYCNNRSFNPDYCVSTTSVTKQ
ncbi:MAG: TIGR01212 family radical SAM protein, partial [Paludibacteraceae bacterium]|nr:TIGR01212 family radical SAM protein [Paludibacteraceae bacterium]